MDILCARAIGHGLSSPIRAKLRAEYCADLRRDRAELARLKDEAAPHPRKPSPTTQRIGALHARIAASEEALDRLDFGPDEEAA